jgi:ribosomal-protein-alanine N-acetyltransferase
MTGAGATIESATTDDLPALVALENRCQTHPWTERGMRDALSPVAGRGEVLVLRESWTANDPHRGIRAYCSYQVVADEAHIHNLAVAPEARRKGLARRLLAHALDVVAGHGARVVHLEVRDGNAAARALYRIMGFREVGKRTAYYSEPVEDAILLNLERPSP